MSEWIISVDFVTTVRRCGVVECDTEEQAIAVSIAYRDRIIAEDVIPAMVITVRPNMAERHGAEIKALSAPEATPTPPVRPKATKRGRS